MTSALENYLDYYKTCTSPGYAVLVTGEWGIGKTYQVKQALKDNIYYVSLFGLKTAEEVHSEIYIAMHPKFSLLANIAKSTEKTAKDAGGVYAIAGMVPGLVNAALRKQVETDKVLVFDDLERCLLETKSIQGIINRYVDECGCRLVIIAHDEKLTDKEGKLERIFIEGKEKIIGQTIRVEPQTEEAFSKFCEGLKKTDRNFIKGYKSEIIRIFKASGKKSLRILKHVMEDLARFYNCLDKKHIAHREAMAELVNLFLALDFEIRNNKLSESDVKDRQKSMMGYYIRYTSNKKNMH